MVKDLLRLLRVKQYVKNVFVLAPLFFSFKFLEAAAVLQAVSAFVAFCLAASFIYINNDIADMEADKTHPRKRLRPLPAGRISVFSARLVAFLLLLLALAVSCFAPVDQRFKLLLVLAAYVAVNVLYSWRLKHIAILDVFVIAAGFILRVYAGAYAIGVPVSSYIFMTTLFLSLFLGFSKRLSEAAKHKETRQVLQLYSLEGLKAYALITAALTIMSYALYTLEAATLERFETNRMIYSVVFVVYGIFHYLNIITTPSSEEDPTENLYRDKPLFLTCLAYLVYVFLIFVKII